MHQAAARHDPLEGMDLVLRRGVRLRVSHHPADGLPLVFLHGGLGNRFNWRRQVEFALRQRWEVLAYDLAGHGDSSPYDRYSIGRHRRDLGRLMTRLGIEDRFSAATATACPWAWSGPAGTGSGGWC